MFTPSQTARIIAAIEECTRFINKEEARDPSTRPAESAAILAESYAHRAKMQEALKNGHL